MTEEDIQSVIDRELTLLSCQVRSSAQQMDELLDPAFREIGASGQFWTRAEMISALASERSNSQGAIETTEMAGEPLGLDLVQLIYVSNRHGRRARRSSLWRRSAGAWRSLFHQGTPLNECSHYAGGRTARIQSPAYRPARPPRTSSPAPMGDVAGSPGATLSLLLQVSLCFSASDGPTTTQESILHAGVRAVSQMTGTFARRVSGLIPYDAPVRSR
jgi:hypothetical protein